MISHWLSANGWDSLIPSQTDSLLGDGVGLPLCNTQTVSRQPNTCKTMFDRLSRPSLPPGRNGRNWWALSYAVPLVLLQNLLEMASHFQEQLYFSSSLLESLFVISQYCHALLFVSLGHLLTWALLCIIWFTLSSFIPGLIFSLHCDNVVFLNNWAGYCSPAWVLHGMDLSRFCWFLPCLFLTT